MAIYSNLSTFTGRAMPGNTTNNLELALGQALPGELQVFADVVVDIQAGGLGDKVFTYSVPSFLRDETFIGSQVLVPFGAQQVGGYVIGLKDKASDSITPKDILEVLEPDPLYDQKYIDFLYWVAEYYGATLAQVI